MPCAIIDIRQTSANLELAGEMWLEFDEHNVKPDDAILDGHSYIWLANAHCPPLLSPTREAEHEA